MIVFPAIDLIAGKVVRLRRGERSQMDVYSDDPVAVAEDFARRHGLDFLHADIYLACDRDERRQSNTFITLRFFRNGSADLHYDEYSPGSSAGSWGGGVCTTDLPRNFYRGCSLEAVAGHFPEALREALMQNEELALFLEKVQGRKSVAVPERRERRR